MWARETRLELHSAVLRLGDGLQTWRRIRHSQLEGHQECLRHSACGAGAMISKCVKLTELQTERELETDLVLRQRFALFLNIMLSCNNTKMAAVVFCSTGRLIDFWTRQLGQHCCPFFWALDQEACYDQPVPVAHSVSQPGEAFTTANHLDLYSAILLLSAHWQLVLHLLQAFVYSKLSNKCEKTPNSIVLLWRYWLIYHAESCQKKKAQNMTFSRNGCFKKPSFSQTLTALYKDDVNAIFPD